MKVRHVRSSCASLACATLAVLTLAACSTESAERRHARLSAIQRLAEIRARLPQFHEDSMVVRGSNATHRIVFRAWLDGAQLAILHEEVRGDSANGRDRFYLVGGALLACSTSYHPIGATYRDMETAALFDPQGHPLISSITIDGRPRFTPRRAWESIRAMHERTIREFWDDYSKPSPSP